MLINNNQIKIPFIKRNDITSFQGLKPSLVEDSFEQLAPKAKRITLKQMVDEALQKIRSTFNINNNENHSLAAKIEQKRKRNLAIIEKFKLRDLGKVLEEEAASHYEEVSAEIKAHFRGHASLIKGRGKSSYSNAAKIANELASKITEIHEQLTKRVKKATAEELIKDFESLHISIEDARKIIKDLLGFKLVLKDASQENADKIFTKICDAIKNGLKITAIDNYRGNNSTPYFTDDQVKHIIAHYQHNNPGAKPIILKTPSTLVTPSGYTTFQMKLVSKDGHFVEFQIRGAWVNELAQVEHIPYDLREGKSLSHGIDELEEHYAPLKKIVYSMSSAEYEQYNNYLAQMYSYARQCELGNKWKTKPELPPNLNQDLSIDKLTELYKAAEEIKAKYRKTKTGKVLKVANRSKTPKTFSTNGTSGKE